MKDQVSIVNIDIFGDPEAELKKVKAALDTQKKNQEEVQKNAQLDRLIHTLRNMAYADIAELSRHGKAPIAIFILCTSLLEQLSVFYYGKNGKLDQFVKEFMRKYDGQEMKKMRDRISHNYSFSEKYAITIGIWEAHLVATKDGATIINIENLVQEIGTVFEQFEKELRVDKKRRDRALRKMNDVGLLQQANIDVTIPDSEPAQKT